MARRPRLEDQLATLHAHVAEPRAPAALAALRDALASKTGVLIAAAAALIAPHELIELVDLLPDAYRRLLDKPVERDPGCRGKAAVLRALHDLDRWDDVFEHARGYVQPEPRWGGSDDTAAGVRAIAGYAYAHTAHRDALDVLAGLLADPERQVRAAAARALGDAGRPDATALLRFKALTGDPDAEVLTACHASLLALAPSASLRFVAAALNAGGEGAGAAALALGESRLEAAVPVLTAWCDRSVADVRLGFVALAILRRDAATDYLLAVVRAEPQRARVQAAIDALASFRDDATLAIRVVEAAAAHEDPATVRYAREQLRVAGG